MTLLQPERWRGLERRPTCGRRLDHARLSLRRCDRFDRHRSRSFLGRPLLIVIAAALITYVVLKFARRRRFLRHLRRARITAFDLRQRLDAGDHLVVADLRTALDIETAPYRIPGARWIPPDSLDQPRQVIPKASEVVFYCAEPRARMARLLDAHGYKHVHPLSGGLDAWRRAGFPVEPAPPPMSQRGLECAIGKLLMDLAVRQALISARSAFFATLR